MNNTYTILGVLSVFAILAWTWTTEKVTRSFGTIFAFIVGLGQLAILILIVLAWLYAAKLVDLGVLR